MCVKNIYYYDNLAPNKNFSFKRSAKKKFVHNTVILMRFFSIYGILIVHSYSLKVNGLHTVRALSPRRHFEGGRATTSEIFG